MDNDSGFLNWGGQIIERGTADGVSSIGEEDDGFRAFTTLEVFDSLCQSLPEPPCCHWVSVGAVRRKRRWDPPTNR